MREANDEKERALELEKARYELARLQSQRTIKLYTQDKGIIYTNDHTSIREAQENLENLEFEEVINGLEKEKDALGDSIEELERYKDKWNNIQKQHEIDINKMHAKDVLGQNWEADVLSGRIDTLNNFANNYFNIQKAIADAAWNSANEQIKAAQAAQNSVSGIVQTVNYGSNYNSPAQIKPKAFGYKVTTGGVDAARGFSSKDDAKKWATSHGIFNYQTPSDIVYEVYLNGSLQATKSTKEEAEEYLKQRYGITKFAKGGVIGDDKSPLDPIAQSLNEDHVVLAKEGERFLTPVQNEMWEKWTEALPNLQNFANMLQYNIPNYNFDNMIIRNNNKPTPTINIGDIHLHEVQNVPDFAKALQKHLPNISVQYNGKH